MPTSEAYRFGVRQERYLVRALVNSFDEERPRREAMVAWATQRQLGSLVERGLFEQQFPGRGTYPKGWKHKQRAEGWVLTDKGIAVARVVRVKWNLAGWGDKGPPSSVKAAPELVETGGVVAW